jgi:hypothetical protein
MTNSRYWQARSEEAWAQSIDMGDAGAQAMMEGIAKTYERLAALDAKLEAAKTDCGRYRNTA